jgi:hypothetical protein
LSATDSTLPESCGTSGNRSAQMFWGNETVLDGRAGAAALMSFSTSCSRCQSLQLRFSSLLPWSTESAQREKTGPYGQQLRLCAGGKTCQWKTHPSRYLRDGQGWLCQPCGSRLDPRSRRECLSDGASLRCAARRWRAS